MQKLLTPLLLSFTALTAGAAGSFSVQTLTGDGDSGISGNNAYTHAIDMGDGPNRTINGAVFTGSGGGGNPGTNNYATAEIPNVLANWPGVNPPGPSVTGATGGLFTNFNYGGANNETLTLNNLRVGQQYTTTFYNDRWGGLRSQNITTSDGGSITFDADNAATPGTLLKYTFTAVSNSLSFTFDETNATPASFHHYAYSNQVVGHKALLTDNFYAPGNPNTLDLNFNLPARQGGSLVTSSGVKTWVAAGNTQVGNNTGGVDGGNYLLDAFGATSAVDYNFNGSASQGGLSVSFDLAPNIGNVGADNWEALNLGNSFADKNGGVNGGHEHFGILFRGQGTIQAFDANIVVSGGVEPTWGPGGVTTALNHFELLITDPGDGNPFDGLGQTTIEVFANGNSVYSFTKGGGGYDQNYLNFQASHIGGIDNLVIAQLIPEPGTVTLAGLAAFALVARRRRNR